MSFIDKTYDMSKYHLFTKTGNKSYLSEKTIGNLKKIIKDTVKAPNKDIKVYIINFFLHPNTENPLKILCGQYTLTTKLVLVMKDDDVSITINYSQDEFEKYGFKKEHIQKIIKAIKENTVSYIDFTDNITHILEVTS